MTPFWERNRREISKTITKRKQEKGAPLFYTVCGGEHHILRPSQECRTPCKHHQQ